MKVSYMNKKYLNNVEKYDVNGYTNSQNWHFVCHFYSGWTFLLGWEKYKFTHRTVWLRQDHHEKEGVQ